MVAARSFRSNTRFCNSKPVKTHAVVRGLAVLFIALSSACAPALPGRSLSQEVGDRALAAGDAAKFAHEAADRAEVKLAESRRLHAEAVQMLEQAKKVEAYCKQLRGKIPKQRVVYIEKKVPVKTEEEVAEEEEAAMPKFSASDAPL